MKKAMPKSANARAIGVSADDKWCVVGMKDGTLNVIDL